MSFGRFYDRLAAILDHGEIEMQTHSRDEQFMSITVQECDKITEGTASFQKWDDILPTIASLFELPLEIIPPDALRDYERGVKSGRVITLHKVNDIYCLGERTSLGRKLVTMIRPTNRATLSDVFHYVGHKVSGKGLVVEADEYCIPEIAAVNPWIRDITHHP